MTKPVILVVGAGPGVGSAVARRFGREGYDVALISRSAESLDTLGRQLQEEGVTAGWAAVDITDQAAVGPAIVRLGDHVGRFDVVHFNPSATTMKSPLTLSPDELLADLRLGVASLLSVVQAARPFMSAGGRIIATGSISADRPWAAAASVGVQKAGLRNLVSAIDAELAPEGIRAASLTVDGVIEHGGPLDPVHIAAALYAAAHQSTGDWQTEVGFAGAPTSDTP